MIVSGASMFVRIVRILLEGVQEEEVQEQQELLVVVYEQQLAQNQ